MNFNETLYFSSLKYEIKNYMTKPILSKSTFLRGLQCEKSLWLYKHRYDLKDEITPQQEAIIHFQLTFARVERSILK